MRNVTNKFGSRAMWTLADGKRLCNHEVTGKIKAYIACVACLSVYTDLLSYISKYKNGENNDIEFSSRLSEDTDIAIVLSCQVTDLSIFNDLSVMEDIHKNYPNVQIFCGGCLAQRFDIHLPEYVRRLDVERAEGTPINGHAFQSVDYKKPFWNKNLKDDADEYEDGNLFRKMYPLKIGAGCHGGCKYCTIRDTRGPSYNTDAYTQIQEFLDHEDVVLICDAPSVKQIRDWCSIADKYNKHVSFRNVEPPVANACRKELVDLAKKGLLKVFHCPVQTLDENLLKAMNRDAKATFEYIETTRRELRSLGVVVATNIIIDYIYDGVRYDNPSKDEMLELFDYYVWNPYFNGNFDYNRAKERFARYIGLN